MSSLRQVWLTSHLLAEPAGAAAHRRAEALGRAVHGELLAAGDRLAATSAVLAQRYYRQAAACRGAFGREGFARWLRLGEELATGEPPCRDAALAFFAATPADFGRGGIETAAAWCDLGRRVARASRRLAASFFERTVAGLGDEQALPRLEAWATAGLRLHAMEGWRGAFLAQAYFEAAPAALAAFAPWHYGRWVEVALALSAPNERSFFASLPAGLACWTDGERERFLASVLALAAGPSGAALVVYRELPPAAEALPAAVRAALLAVLARLDVSAAAPLAEVAPVIGAVLLAVPADERVAALRLVAEVAAVVPAAAVAALRVLPRLFEEARPEQVRRWFTAGLAVARDGAAAGHAYFALVSRTSLRVLREHSTAAALEETQGVWRKLVQMMSGEPVAIRGIDRLTLRLPLEDAPAEGSVALPARIDCLPTHEDNCRVYRFLAAQLAGRREFGTYAFAAPDDDGPPGSALRRALRSAAAPDLLEGMFLLAEGVRIHHRSCAVYPGLAADASWVGTRLLAHWATEEPPSRDVVLDALLALMLGAEWPASGPPWLEAGAVALLARLVAPLALPSATVDDAMRVACALTAGLVLPATREAVADAVADLLMLDDLGNVVPVDGLLEEPGADVPRLVGVGAMDGEEMRLELAPPGADLPAGSRPLSLEELRRLLEAGARIEQATGEGSDGPGLSITDLVGKLPSAQLEALRRMLGDVDSVAVRPVRHGAESTPEGAAFFYDEWDHGIGDYRSRWCRLHEVGLEGDSGEFFSSTLGDYARLVPAVRRQFQRIRPEMYRTVRGLEDGEDFDLNAVVEARVEARARRAPSTRFYRARVREVRDVATLFLLDMSASTDEPLAGVAGRGPGRRIIDVAKEALVIMVEALEELGDAYAIYGFSGQGRDNVEFYPVKGFAEPLGPTVKARIGGIVPKRSTRMGTALRHAVEKMSGVSARVKHLILLSDGFPQDHDYGDDRRSHAYGIRDTAVALREADAAGITPFCITVDRAGHDYLREMCDPSRYVVIEDIAALPQELPRIYQRVVRA